VIRGQFHQHMPAAFSREQDEKLFLANFTLHIGQISSAQNVGEIDWQIFRQTLYTGNFLLGAQRLVKLTPEATFDRKSFKRKVNDPLLHSMLAAITIRKIQQF
jgi:hypothetical protein